MIKELQRFRISIAGVQENKWFGNDVWLFGQCTFLHSGKEVPPANTQCFRNEGVGIFLDEDSTAAWKAGGGVWKAVSSHIVTARLKFGTSGTRMRDLRSKSGGFMSVISVYAPTYRTSDSTRKVFYDSLQDTLDSIPKRIFIDYG